MEHKIEANVFQQKSINVIILVKGHNQTQTVEEMKNIDILYM